jgi:hypothetical protein
MLVRMQMLMAKWDELLELGLARESTHDDREATEPWRAVLALICWVYETLIDHSFSPIDDLV